MYRKKVLAVTIIIFSFAGLLLTIALLKQHTDNFTHAAAADKLEAEGGTLSSTGVSRQTDSLASGQTYVLFTNQTPTPTPNQTGGVGLSQCSALDKGTARIAPPSLSMPGYLESVIDPSFGTKITRVTGNSGSSIPNVPGQTWRNSGGSTYSKIPAWNADQTLLAMQNTSAPGLLILDGNTYEVKLFRFNVPGLTTYETRWHPTDPSLRIYVTSDGKAGYWNPITNTVMPKFDPGAGFSSCAIGPWEGNVSLDGKKVVISCQIDTTNANFFAVDLSTGTRISPIMSLSDMGFNNLDWATISPKGDYIVVSQSSALNRSLSFTTNSYAVKATWQNMGHYDLGIDTLGNEVAANAQGYFVRLSDGVATNILSRIPYPQYHTSTRNTNAPGWMYASPEGLSGSTLAMDNEIIAMELKSSGKIRRLTNTRNSNASYEHSVFGAASPDGKRVFYRSDWGNSSGPVYGFVVDTRNVCP